MVIPRLMLDHFWIVHNSPKATVSKLPSSSDINKQRHFSELPTYGYSGSYEPRAPLSIAKLADAATPCTEVLLRVVEHPGG